MKISQLFKAILFAVDLGVVAVAFYAGTLLKFGSLQHPFIKDAPLLLILLGILAVWGAVFYFVGLYREKRGLFPELDEIGTVVLGCTLGALTIIILTFFVRELLYSRRVIAYAWALSSVFISLTHLLGSNMLHWLYGREIGVQRLFLIVKPAEREAVLKRISKLTQVGYRVVGHDPGEDLLELRKKLKELNVNFAVIAISLGEISRILDIIQICEETKVKVWVIPGILELVASKLEVDDIDGIPFISLLDPAQLGWQYFLKRCFDMSFSVILLLLLSPVFAAIALLIKLTSPGPVFYAQKRVGTGGRTFDLIKFRTMQRGADRKLKELLGEIGASKMFFKIKDDPRVTPLGRRLRKYSLDELPQLINVFKGEMSLVGPRPSSQAEMDNCPPWMRKRLKVPPGITGLWQISGRSDRTDLESMQLDIYYIEHWTFWLDIKILLRTIPAVFLARGAY